MKRVLFLGLFVFAFAASSFAGQGIVIEKMNDNKTFDRVARYLVADTDQERDLKYVFARADREYKRAIKKGATIDEAAVKAMNFSLANSKVILTKEQYGKLLLVINSTVVNHDKSINDKLLADK